LQPNQTILCEHVLPIKIHGISPFAWIGHLTGLLLQGSPSIQRAHFKQWPMGNQLSELVFSCQNMNGSGKTARIPAILLTGKGIA